MTGTDSLHPFLTFSKKPTLTLLSLHTEPEERKVAEISRQTLPVNACQPYNRRINNCRTSLLKLENFLPIVSGFFSFLPA